jgi:hypothetical protein
MFNFFTVESKKILYNSQVLAKNFEHSVASTEHVLLSILKTNSFATEKLYQRGLTYRRIETMITEIYKKKLKLNQQNKLPEFSTSMKQIFRKCFFYSYKKKQTVSTELLLAILLLRPSQYSKEILRYFFVDYNLIIRDLYFFLASKSFLNAGIIYNSGKIQTLFPSSKIIKLLLSPILQLLQNSTKSVSDVILLKNSNNSSRLNSTFLNLKKKRYFFLPKIVRLPKFRKFVWKTIKQKSETSYFLKYSKFADKLFKLYKYNIKLLKKNSLKLETKSFFLFDLKSFFQKLELQNYFFYPKNIFYLNFEIPYQIELDFFMSIRKDFLKYDMPLKEWEQIIKKEKKEKKKIYKNYLEKLKQYGLD